MVKKWLLAMSAVLAMGSALATAGAADPLLVRPYASLQFSEKVPGNPQIALPMGPGRFWYQPAGQVHGAYGSVVNVGYSDGLGAALARGMLTLPTKETV